MGISSERQHPGEFISSEHNPTLSRETGVLAARDTLYLDGTVLILEGGELEEFVGSGSVVGLLIGSYRGGVEAVYLARGADVVDELIPYSSPEIRMEAVAALALREIIVVGVVVEIATEGSTEDPTEGSTEDPTEGSTGGTESPTEPPTEPVTELPTEQPTEEETFRIELEDASGFIGLEDDSGYIIKE